MLSLLLALYYRQYGRESHKLQICSPRLFNATEEYKVFEGIAGGNLEREWRIWAN